MKVISTIHGGEKYPDINGTVEFMQTDIGVFVTAEIYNLPSSNMMCKDGIFAFHIHNGSSCSGNNEDEFANSKGHFNPDNCPHPYHAGDLPPLFSNNGFAFMQFLTNRFNVDEILGKTVIIHSNVDDFTSQPSGNPGEKIACGEIKKQD